jgi:hypothetical protein
MLPVLALLILVLAAVLLYAKTRPDTFRVQRSVLINAPAEAIFPLINDFHSWVSWSPYEKKDLHMKKTYGGPESGKGATYAWEGNNKVGSGKMEILDSTAPSKVLLSLEFFRPMKASNAGSFTLDPKDGGTEVTWSMEGRQTLMGKAMGLVMDMDSLVGKDFETGLQNIKTLTEK